MIKIFILDDEPAAANVIHKLLEKVMKEKYELQYSNDSISAINQIKTFDPDLLFLDVEMPNMNGFEVLNEISDLNFNVIFTTAHEKYAIKAIKFSALDYLLKPIDKYELESAINRYLEKEKELWRNDNTLLHKNLNHNLNSNEEQFKLAINVKEGNFLFQLNELICFEANNNYTKIYFTNHKPILVSKTLKEYDDLLNEYHFMRVHKSYLVNKNYITSLDHDGNLILKDGIITQVSRRNKAELMEMFKNK